jgi:hypothetical protein
MKDPGAEWCRANLGKAVGELPDRPAENQCELCGMVFKAKLRPDYDPQLEQRGLPSDARHRGWVCRGCYGLLKWIERVNEKKLFDYLDRQVVFGDPPPEYPTDGRCQICSKWCGNELHHDHDHDFEALGYAIEDSQRGYLCPACNINRVARVDRIGSGRLKKYLGRARY